VPRRWSPRLTTAVAADYPLNPREREVADLVVEGLTNHEIAGRLYLSERTVESHVRSALMKVGARNRAQLIRRDRRVGINVSRRSFSSCHPGWATFRSTRSQRTS
jgi:DNA-binding NarL/FixJ family response regulator